MEEAGSGKQETWPQRRLKVGAAVVAGALVLVALGYLSIEQEDPSETLLAYTNDTVKSLDPATASDRASAVPIGNIFETLVGYHSDETTGLVARLATSWTVSPDMRWYNLSLRTGVLFSNGNPFTAGDVRFTIERVVAMQGLEEETRSRVVLEFVDAENTTVVDDYTIAIKLLKPHAGFLAVLASSTPMGILDKEYTLAHYSPTDEYARSFMREHPMGTGPYALEEWREGSYIALVRNKHYWQSWEGEHFKKVVLREDRDLDERKEALLEGRADLIEIPTLSFADFEPASDLLIRQTRGFQVDLVLMNTETESSTHAFMRDSGVRQAFCYAFNYDNISANLYSGCVEELQGVIPNGFPMEAAAQPTKGFQFNLTMASQLLNESGYNLNQYGARFSGTYLDFLVNDSDPHKLAIAFAFKGDLNRLGIYVNLRNVSGKYYQVTGYWDMCIVSYSPEYIDPAAPVQAIAVSSEAGGDEYFTGTWDPLTDLAAAAAASAPTDELRIEEYNSIWTRHNANPNVILIGQVMQVCAYSPMLNDFFVDPAGLYSFYEYSG